MLKDIAGSGGNVELDTTLTQSGKAADAAAVGKAFSDRIEGGYFDDTGNLVFEDKVTIGSCAQIDGSILANQYTGRYCVTDYLSVKPSTSYALFTEVGIVFNCAQYRADKTFIEGTVASYPALITTHADCVYLVVSYRDANDSVGQGCLVVKQSAERVYEYTPPRDIPLKFVGVDYATVEQVATMAGDTDAKLNLPDKYEIVAGDWFELFWSGVIVSTNPECYWVDVTCEKGTPFKRFFRYLPSDNDVGTYDMVVKLYNYKHNLVAEKTVQLVVKKKATSPTNRTVVMYVGDSLTANGYVPDEMYRRLTATDGNPVGDGLSNIVFIGDKISTENGVPYVGTGGWTFASYNASMVNEAYMTVTVSNHAKTNADQHSVYADSNGVQWKIETVRPGQIDLIRVSDSGTLPTSGKLTWVSGGVDHTDIVYTGSAQAAGNPFWDNETGKISFAKFVANQGENTLDYVYVLLGWNATYQPRLHYIADAKNFIDNVLADFPNCKIVLLGLQMPSWDGCALNYGAKSDTMCHRHELINYVYNHDLWCAAIAESYPNNVSYLNISGQFDSENNMQTDTRPVNVRNSATETGQINGVHPAVSGYMQIADACYRDFTHKLQS
jgi:hypothetical protein